MIINVIYQNKKSVSGSAVENIQLCICILLLPFVVNKAHQYSDRQAVYTVEHALS